MKEIFLEVDVIFLEIAKGSFNFPLVNSIRTSFWLLNSENATFSEVYFQNDDIDVWKIYRGKIKIVERDFLINKLKKGSEFQLGTYPNAIAFGKIIEPKNQF